ncbi:MAG: Smr/MutS family protein [Hydrotalea sp.]|nr:Smr/MutS family protein [Hydrotalea sp.]
MPNPPLKKNNARNSISPAPLAARPPALTKKTLPPAPRRLTTNYAPVTIAPPPAVPNTVPNGTIKKSQKNLPIDGRLDLHGMTAAQGFTALDNFFYNMRAGGRRHLLIITGKGTGVMKHTLQQFLERHHGIIASHQLADPRRGGDGAHYIVLKKSAISKQV